MNGAPLVGETRRRAEARCRLVAGLTILSAGTPMFLFGEEVGTDKPLLYDRVLEFREDLLGLRAKGGANMFRYYADLIRLRRGHPGLSSRQIDPVFVHNDHRLLAFHRWGAGEELLVIGSFNNRPFDRGYVFNNLRIPDGGWREIFNSDAGAYGGDNIGNLGAVLPVGQGRFEAVLPACACLVFQKA